MHHGVSRGADGLRHAVNESTGGDRSPEPGIVIVVPGTVAVMRRRNRTGRRCRGMSAGTAESGAARAAVGGAERQEFFVWKRGFTKESTLQRKAKAIRIDERQRPEIEAQ